MNKRGNNPPANQLPPAISEDSLIESIGQSGYPLQGLVAHALMPDFGVTEEWGYIDRDTHDHRALDVFAYRRLFNDSSQRTLPALAMLIECKRTTHAHIFFQRITGGVIPEFPSVPGCPRGRTSVSWGTASQDAHPSRVLGLGDSPFLSPPEIGPPVCASFTKAHRQGKTVEMSGTEPFNSLILPLVKAHDSAQNMYRWDERDKEIRPTLLLCLAVLDGPMVLVDEPDCPSNAVLAPWVRVVRQEVNQDKFVSSHFRYYAVDVVHFGFLAEYVKKHLLPFAETFAERAAQMHEVLLRGATAPGQSWNWHELKPGFGR